MMGTAALGMPAVPCWHMAPDERVRMHACVQRDPAEAPLTGCVVDVGEGTTHVVPVVDGYVLGGAAASMPLAGREVSTMVQHMLR